MLTSDDKVGGWVKKGQNHDDVILEWPLPRVHSPWVRPLYSFSIRKTTINLVGIGLSESFEQ